MMRELRICHLFEEPVYIKVVSEWIYQEFWKDKPGFSRHVFEEKLKNASNKNQIPLSLIAFLNEIPVGTINLIDNDDEVRPHLSPWLAALVVKPEYRGEGIGSKLVAELLSVARSMGIQKLYLGTAKPGFYKRLGAAVHEQARPGFFIMEFG